MQQRDAQPDYEAILVCTLFVLVNALSYLFQERLSFNSGKGWDGVEYFAVAEQFSHGQLPHAAAPFVYRIGTPLLASLVPTDDLLDAFFLLNLFANAVTIVLLTVFFRTHIGNWKVKEASISWPSICQYSQPHRNAGAKSVLDPKPDYSVARLTTDRGLQI